MQNVSNFIDICRTNLIQSLNLSGLLLSFGCVLQMIFWTLTLSKAVKINKTHVKHNANRDFSTGLANHTQAQPQPSGLCEKKY